MNDDKNTSAESHETQMEELRRRYREARAKRLAAEEKYAAAQEKREAEERARLEENAARDLPHIQAAEEEHGLIKVVNTPLGAIVLKRPNHLAFKKFTRRASSSKGIDEMDVWRLVKPCIVYPDVARVEEIIEEFPGVEIRMGNKVLELGNGETEEAEGK